MRHRPDASWGKVLASLEGTRHARAKQFLTACLVRRIAVDDPAGLEAEIDGCVALLRAREVA